MTDSVRMMSEFIRRYRREYQTAATLPEFKAAWIKMDFWKQQLMRELSYVETISSGLRVHRRVSLRYRVIRFLGLD